MNIEKPENEEIQTLESVACAAAPVAMEKKQVNILLAEDNLINRQVIIHFLGRLGYSSVDIAQNGTEAVSAYHNKRYDLIFMDCQMPEMDGYLATQKIREIEITRGAPPVPVIAMTAHTLKGDKENCLKAGMDDYLSKPLNISGLEQMISRWILDKKS